jgi:hypothetical protein
MPLLQAFGNSAIQLTFFPEVNKSIPSWTIFVFCATFHNGHATSLSYGQNKSAILIHALVQPSTTWSSQTSVIPTRNTLLTVHQMPEPQSWLWDVSVHQPLTQDHVELMRYALCSIKQGHQEFATSYLNRIWTLTHKCYHAGIPNTDA